MSDVNGAPGFGGGDAGEVLRSSLVNRPAVERAARLNTAMWAALDRALPVLRQIVRGVRFFAWSGIVAAVVIIVSLLLATGMPSAGAAVFLLILAAVLAVPGVLLLLFHGAVVEALALPDWLRSSPEVARSHATELARLARASAGDGTAPTRRGFARNFFKAGKLLLEAHGDFPEYGKMLRLISVPFLFAVGVSFVAVIVEWFVAVMTFLVAMLATIF
jgi:hypothetical protein